MFYRIGVYNDNGFLRFSYFNGSTYTWMDVENARSRLIADTGYNKVKHVEVQCPVHGWQTLLGNGTCEMCQEEADRAKRQFSRIVSKFEVR